MHPKSAEHRGLLAPPLLVSPDEGADHGDGAEDARPEEESSTGAGLRLRILGLIAERRRNSEFGFL